MTLGVEALEDSLSMGTELDTKVDVRRWSELTLWNSVSSQRHSILLLQAVTYLEFSQHFVAHPDGF